MSTKATGTHIYENAEISPQNDAYLQIETCTSTSLVIFWHNHLVLNGTTSETKMAYSANRRCLFQPWGHCLSFKQICLHKNLSFFALNCDYTFVAGLQQPVGLVSYHKARLTVMVKINMQTLWSYNQTLTDTIVKQVDPITCKYSICLLLHPRLLGVRMIPFISKTCTSSVPWWLQRSHNQLCQDC
jgi:hypothetical protein